MIPVKHAIHLCTVMNVDIMDDTGEHSSGYSQDVTKVRLDLEGVPIATGETVSKLINNIILKRIMNQASVILF